MNANTLYLIMPNLYRRIDETFDDVMQNEGLFYWLLVGFDAQMLMHDLSHIKDWMPYPKRVSL